MRGRLQTGGSIGWEKRRSESVMGWVFPVREVRKETQTDHAGMFFTVLTCDQTTLHVSLITEALREGDAS